MSRFDPEERRTILLDWAIESELAEKMEDHAPKSVGTAAEEMLDRVVTGWIVALREEVRPVLEKSRAWLEESLARNEMTGAPPSYFAMLREEAHALAIWMLENRSDRAKYARALELHEAAWAEIAQKREFPASEALEYYISGYLRDCLQAQDWEKGIAAYLRFGGRPVKDASDIRSDAEFGYWACSNRLPRRGAAVDYLAVAGRVFGQGLMEEWLAHGDMGTAAAWLKIIYWESGAVGTPQETLLKAYELMPGVTPPQPAG
jgi:hypothetical protein